MATPAERKALLFLSGVILLGASVRVVRAARNGEAADPATRQALAAQLAAVDSARESSTANNRSRTPRSKWTAGSSGGSRPRTQRRAESASSPAAGSRCPESRCPGRPQQPIDLDRATAQELETLPRIGPVLAQRILEDRAQHGPFGSLDELQRVRGVGPALAEGLRGRVTFSGTARPSNAVASTRFRSASTSTRSPRRDPRD